MSEKFLELEKIEDSTINEQAKFSFADEETNDEETSEEVAEKDRKIDRGGKAEA